MPLFSKPLLTWIPVHIYCRSRNIWTLLVCLVSKRQFQSKQVVLTHNSLLYTSFYPPSGPRSPVTIIFSLCEASDNFIADGVLVPDNLRAAFPIAKRAPDSASAAIFGSLALDPAQILDFALAKSFAAAILVVERNTSSTAALTGFSCIGKFASRPRAPCP